MNSINDNILKVIYRRVYDIAGTMPFVNVSLNNELINIKSFK